MIKLLVVGTVAYDSIETPFGKAENVLGGSALHFAGAASFFTDVGMVAAIGEDFDLQDIAYLGERNVDMRGIKVHQGRTFRWEGQYGYDLNQAVTLKTELNVIERYRPHVPKECREADFVFLANIDPELQAHVIEQVRPSAVVALDTMNYWIESKYDALMEVVKKVDMLVINEAELREMTKEHSLVKASRQLLKCGPRCVVAKRGEYGVFMMTEEEIFLAPAYPLEDVFDPTGAGDTFAGGFMGYLANVGDVSPEAVKQAIIMGSVMASFNVEDFSVRRVRGLANDEIRERYRSFKACLQFGDVDFG